MTPTAVMRLMTHANHRRNRGLSLIELMIAMALGLVLVSTIGFAYVGAKNSFQTQTAMSRIQENARYAFEFIGRDVRMAGFNGGPGDADPTQPVGWTGEKDLANHPLLGYEEGASTFPTFPVSRPRLRGDALTIVHADTENEYALDTTISPNPSTTTFTLASTPSTTPAVGGIFIGADYTRSSVFALTLVNGKELTTADSLGVFSGDISTRRVYPLSGATYYIATNPSGEPSLYRLTLNNTGGTTAEELVEGIYDIQFRYGVDYSSPSAATAIAAAVWTSNRATFTSIAHGLIAGDYVTVSGVTPSGYNGHYRVLSADPDTFTVDQPTAPGAYSTGGTAKKASDNSVDDYWTADEVTAGVKSAATIPGPATTKNYWSHVISVQATVTLASRQTEKLSTSGGTVNKTFTSTFAIRNRL